MIRMTRISIAIALAFGMGAALAQSVQRGGVTVSDALGVRALRRFYDPTERTFQSFNIARDAFLAGNDVLYLGEFAGPGPDQSAVIKSVLAQFVQKYNEDPAFAQRVDQAVARIIQLKLNLYGEFSVAAIAPRIGLAALGAGAEDVLAVTRDAATLVSPTSSAELANRLPSRPTLSERIVFITDARATQQCSACASQPVLPVDAMQHAVLRLYGPEGTSETFAARLSSYSFTDVIRFLESGPVAVTSTPALLETATPGGDSPTPTLTPTPAPPGVSEAIGNADWVVFAMLDIKVSSPESQALKRLLAERPDLLQGKHVIAFAFDAPYYLDATEVAQLTAYYALYNHSSNAVEVAARILFQEIAPAGASPVSVEAVGYKLIDATQPDPDQIISLTYELPPTEGLIPTPIDTTATPAPVSAPVVRNDIITLHTSLIVDRNGRLARQGTQEFHLLRTKFVAYFREETDHPEDLPGRQVERHRDVVGLEVREPSKHDRAEPEHALRSPDGSADPPVAPRAPLAHGRRRRHGDPV